MKKKLFLCLFVLFFSVCYGQGKAVWNLTKIAYTTHSRGSYQQILIENKTVSVVKNREEKPNPFTIAAADWICLNKAVQAFNLELLPNLKAPTQKRFFDGASSACLKISYNGKQYESQNFDHGYPPLELKKLVTLITSFAQ
jgi:hypothetical protein